MRRIVVIGASLGGLRAGEAIRKAGFESELVIVGTEAHAPYDRPPLSKSFIAATSAPPNWLRQADSLAPVWRLGLAATQLSADRRTVGLDDGTSLEYDGLVIATGLRARELPDVPTTGRRTHTLRTLDDAARLRTGLSGAHSLVIIGGGFIGAELASTAQARGLQTSIVSPVPLMQRGLGVLAPSASERARQAGVRVFDSHTIAHFAETRDVVEVHLAGDQCIVADHVVVAIGGVPNVEWLQGSGLELDNGLLCDVTLAASGRDEIVGVGDVVSWPHPAAGGGLLRLEHWTNATEQARAAAHRLVTGERRPFAPVPSFWTDQFDTRIHGIGLPGLADTVDIIEGDPAGRRFLAEYRLNGELVGAVAAGPATLLLPYRQTLANRMQASIASNLLSLNGPPIRT